MVQLDEDGIKYVYEIDYITSDEMTIETGRRRVVQAERGLPGGGKNVKRKGLFDFWGKSEKSRTTKAG